MDLSRKIATLEQIIEGLGAVAVAYSGGVDSAYLAYVCQKALKERAIAITIKSMFIPENEISAALDQAKKIGITHHVISLKMTDNTILSNPRERCYFCKKLIFNAIQEKASALGNFKIVDGSNLDDLSDFRPGMKALKEMNIQSPLVDAGFYKSDIRLASRQAKLDTWDAPSMACLASRIPYGQMITASALSRVEKAETYLRQRGIKQARVRSHEDAARIEVAPEERQIFFDLDLMDQVADQLRQFGFKYISLDLEGYRTGKLN